MQTMTLRRVRSLSAVGGSFVVAAALLLSGCAGGPSAQRTARLSGAELYARLCASCHGHGGQGDGPVAATLSVPVPDLTRLAWRDGGEFPREDVRRAIDGRQEYRAHGSREMPVWGIRFLNLSSTHPERERAKVEQMIDRLVEYLEEVQRL
jgi:Cytochrome c.